MWNNKNKQYRGILALICWFGKTCLPSPTVKYTFKGQFVHVIMTGCTLSNCWTIAILTVWMTWSTFKLISSWWRVVVKRSIWATLNTHLITCTGQNITVIIFQYALIHQSEARTTRGIKTYIVYILRALFYILLPLFLLHSGYCEMSFCHAPYTDSAKTTF